MAFQIKDFASIVAGMVNHMRGVTTRITDYNVGSVARTLIEAPAIEIDALYQQMFNGLREGIPVAIYNAFDFAAGAATAATGTVRVTITSSAAAVTIGAGTRFVRSDGAMAYVSTADITIAAGQTYGDVPVAADVAGASGNLAAGDTFTPSPSPANFVSAGNSAPLRNGADAETDDERKARFAAYVQTLARGTVAALDYGLRTTQRTDANGLVVESVRRAAIIEPYVADPLQPVGWVKCYIHNGVGSTSGALVTAALQVVNGYVANDGTKVPGWKAAGVKVEVFAATETAVAVTGVVTAAAGYDAATLRAAVQQAIYAYLLDLDIGATAIRSEIIARAMEIEGVYNFTMSAPSGDTTAAATVKLMPGTFTLT